jgi:predicted DNA binding CopG/RHH family protein
MPKQSRRLPKFKSEEEELRFWDEHHPADFFTQPADVIIKLKRGKKRMVSVRIDEELRSDLKELAAKHGVPYQRLMRELLRYAVANLKRRERALAEEEARQGAAPDRSVP